MPPTQSAANHTRLDPIHHPAMLLLALNVLVAIAWAFVAHTPGLPLRMWVVLVSVALLIGSMKARMNALKVQDRTIRLEEQLRYIALLSPTEVAAAHALPLPSIIALRFASDAELPMLLDRTVRDRLTPAQIKQAITSWRPDTRRV